MSKKKVYIFISWDCITIGGTEMYTAGKAKYLENHGWKVYVFFPKPIEDKVAIPSLAKYVFGGGMEFLFTPPYKMRKFEQDYFLNIMLRRLNFIPTAKHEIIIESHGILLAFWAELLAEKIGARHIFSFCDELYRPNLMVPNPDNSHSDNLDFFYFKWKRNELIASEAVLKKLFNGYKNVTKTQVEMPATIREQDAVQDVAFPIEQLQKLDWNICHIGRAAKMYVPYVIEGIGELARRHPDKRINFIMVGKAEERQALIVQTFRGLTNVIITALGDLVPIPRVLFTKVDVVCAISQSARFAANEGVLTICGNASEPSRTPGVLGYDVEEQVYGAGTFSYVEALENVLVKKLYSDKKYSLPKLPPAEEYYDNFWTILKNASPVKEYYTKRLSQERIRTWTAIFPFGVVARGARIIFFGETTITKDYRRQIDSQVSVAVEFGREYVKNFKARPYCEVVATVDEHPEEFDDTVVSTERLKDKDYDAIVLCAFPQNAQAAYNKIAQIVPDMTNRVVYNLQVVRL